MANVDRVHVRSAARWDWFYSLLLGVSAVAILEVSAKFEWVSQLLLPAPSDVGRTLVTGFTEGGYGGHLVATLTGLSIGFVCAAVVGLSIAIALVASPRLERIVLPYIIALQATPKIAIAPLIIVWVGFGTPSKVLIVTLVAMFPIMINTMQGLRILQREFVELSRSLGASNMQLIRYIRIPTALPSIFAGLHLGIIYSLLACVVAEFVGSRSGLGVVLIQQKALFNVPGVFAALLLLMVIGVILNAVTGYVERKVVFWGEDQTVVGA